jgi:hypothetical protein
MYSSSQIIHEKEEIVHPFPLGNFPEFLETAVFHHHRRDFEVHDERAADIDRPLSFLDKTGAGFFARGGMGMLLSELDARCFFSL